MDGKHAVWIEASRGEWKKRDKKLRSQILQHPRAVWKESWDNFRILRKKVTKTVWEERISKVEKILKGSPDSISSPSLKIQNMGGKVYLRCKGKKMLGVVNKIFVFLTQVIVPANNLNFHWRWWVQIQAIFVNLFYFIKPGKPIILKGCEILFENCLMTAWQLLGECHNMRSVYLLN